MDEKNPAVWIRTEVRARFDVSELGIRQKIIRSGKSTEVQLSQMWAVWTRVRTGIGFSAPFDVQIEANLIGANGTPVKKAYRFDVRREGLKPELRKLIDEFDPAGAEKEDRGE